MSKSFRVSLLALLVALTLVLGWLESLFPLPFMIPGVKLGLSNVALLFSLYTLRRRETLLLLLAKVILSSLLFAGFPAFAYALTGGICALAGMIFFKERRLAVMGVSVGGAACHTIGQVAAAIVLLGTEQILYLLAVLLVASVAAGLVTGLAAALVLRALDKSNIIKTDKPGV